MKPDRGLPESEALQILQNGTYGVLSTCSLAGVPYGVPVNYVYVPAERAIYFHCFVAGRKLDNLRENDRVSFVVVGEQQIMPERFVTHYTSVLVEGHAALIVDPEEKTKRLLQLCQALVPTALARRDQVIRQQLAAVNIVRISVNSVTGKRNRDD